MADDAQLVAHAISYLDAHTREQPGLEALAAEVGVSPFHLQRVFKRWAGVSPKRFLQLATLEHAKAALAASASVLDASYDAGLSGPGRLHDLFVTLEAMTPGEYKAGGAALTIDWGVHASPFGECLLAATPRGICWLAFLGDLEDAAEGLAELRATWPQATLRERPRVTAPLCRRLFAAPFGWDPRQGSLTLVVRGTNFQVAVWRALLRVPPGALVSYAQLAAAVGRPQAVRAVGGAVGANPVSFLIPCHRVIRKTGAFQGYRWGTAIKRALLAWEAGQVDALVAQKQT